MPTYAVEGYCASRSSKGLQTAFAKSMMSHRSQNRLSQAVTGAGREWPVMPSSAGERQRGGHRIAGVLGIIRAPTGTPEVRRLA
jgi:hypothetical protein